MYFDMDDNSVLALSGAFMALDAEILPDNDAVQASAEYRKQLALALFYKVCMKNSNRSFRVSAI